MTIDNYKAYLMVACLGFYVAITVAATAIIATNKQETVIEEQTQSILYLTSELIETKQILAEIESDSRMLQELGK